MRLVEANIHYKQSIVILLIEYLIGIQYHVSDPVKAGSASYKSQRKLTMEDARAIRASELNHTHCAKLYGVSRALIRGIRANRTYTE